MQNKETGKRSRHGKKPVKRRSHLYDSDSPMVGLGLIYKAPYIQTTSWTEAYFDLKLASQAEVGS